MMLLCLISVTLSVTVMTAVKVEPPIEWESKISMHNALFAEDDTGAINVEGYPGIYLVRSYLKNKTQNRKFVSTVYIFHSHFLVMATSAMRKV